MTIDTPSRASVRDGAAPPLPVDDSLGEATTPRARTGADAGLAADLLTVDPAGLGGLAVRALPGPARDWLVARLRSQGLPDRAVRKLPLNIGDDRLLGGLDLAATLASGRPMQQRGLLAEVAGGLLLIPMAERLSVTLAARLGAVLDTGEVVVERDGFAARSPARFGIVALDEGMEPDERPPAALLDRLAIHLDLSDLRGADLDALERDPAAFADARDRLPRVLVDATVISALCDAAARLGIESLRAPQLALRVARAAAALDGRLQARADDAALAARLVLAPRARRLPDAADNEQAPPEPPPPEPEAPDSSQDDDASDADSGPDEIPLEEIILAAAQAAIPEGVLAGLRLGPSARGLGGRGGRAGALRQTKRRGRPIGSQRGELRPGERLNVVETLRTAAPWQPLRRQELGFHPTDGPASARRWAGRARRWWRTQVLGGPPAADRIIVHQSDFRLVRFKERSETTTIFVVDASGSAALHRLAEAKGAVELLLADCYVRRDSVALIAFRGLGAEVLLPPVRSLTRAKRVLAGLPGGGGTPLAAGLDAAADLVELVQRRGDSPVVVLLTDARANVTRAGDRGRAQAEEDALASARRLHEQRGAVLLVDTAPRPQPFARTLAGALGARYLALPRADASALSRVAREAGRSG